jgi:hypothetical protein
MERRIRIEPSGRVWPLRDERKRQVREVEQRKSKAIALALRRTSRAQPGATIRANIFQTVLGTV